MQIIIIVALFAIDFILLLIWLAQEERMAEQAEDGMWQVRKEMRGDE